MSTTLDQPLTPDMSLASHLSVHKMPAHWLMARLGKRVLRPGGLETTKWLLGHARIGAGDEVIELAPGLGTTARAILASGPRSYEAVERDASAAAFSRQTLAHAGFSARVLHGDASQIPLPDACATLVVGEAMLSMQPAEKKRAIVAEAHRLLRPGGRYLVHDLAVQPDGLDAAVLEGIQSDLSDVIHVGVRIGTLSEWRARLEAAGFEIDHATTAPMRLLEPDRLVRDEGLFGAARFVVNALHVPDAARRLLAVRRAFRRHQDHLCAVALVARRPIGG
jgi:ubiquinone/menaquinone biosynthesis C-methylase UbiE